MLIGGDPSLPAPSAQNLRGTHPGGVARLLLHHNRTGTSFDPGRGRNDTLRPMPGRSQFYRVASLLAAATTASCSNPLQDRVTQELRRSIIDSAQRELGQSAASPAPHLLTRESSELSFSDERLEELESMAGPDAYDPVAPLPLGKNLLDEPFSSIRINLQQAVMTGVRNNLSVQFASLDPAITESRIIAAESVFDWTFFADFTFSKQDAPQRVPVVGGFNVGVGAQVSHSNSYTTGLSKRLTSGGVLTLSQGQINTDDSTPGRSLSPDPSNEVFVELGLSQPLLRGFGSDVALAEVRLVRNLDRSTIQQLRATLITTVAEIERAYWDLAFARRTLEVQQRLLERGLETRDVLESRLSFDVKPAEFSDAVATVERRRANLIRATNQLQQASDRLKLLMNDPGFPIGDETLILPIDDAIDEPISFSLLDSIITALDHRPEVQQAILAIDDASIRLAVADNARLPMLDLELRTRFSGLDRSVGDAYEQVTEADFVNYLVGVQFEQPIGNRGAEAEYRQRQLERMQATVGYRQAVQAIVLEVKTALRNVQTNYRLIEQTRSSRLAATENLRTLLVQESTIQSLSPDFLDLKFRRQEALALAEIEEAGSLVEYNIAISQLHAAMGTALRRNQIRIDVPDAKEAIRRAGER